MLRTIIHALLVVFYLGVPGSAAKGEQAVDSKPRELGDEAGGDVRILNNLVTELLNVPTPQQEAVKDHLFTNPRHGWVFISAESAAQGHDKVVLSIDSVPEGETGILYGIAKGGTLEFMRQLPAGTYQLRVRSEGVSRPSSIVVLAIPELIYTGLGYFIPGWDTAATHEPINPLRGLRVTAPTTGNSSKTSTWSKTSTSSWSGKTKT